MKGIIVKGIINNSDDTHLGFINNTYFGNTIEDIDFEKTRDYLKDDLVNSMCSVVHLNILNYILKMNGYNMALEDLRNLCMIGLVSNTRKLIKGERRKTEPRYTGEVGSCTGGDFIDDLCELGEEDLERFKEFRLPMAVVFGNGALDCSKKCFEEVRASAMAFRDRGYYHEIIKNNEGVLLHKNRFPEKRAVIDCHIQDCKSPFSSGKTFKSIVTTYRSNVDMNLLLVSECLNDISGVIMNYEKLMYEFGIEFVDPPQSNAREYIRGVMRIYEHKLCDKDANIVTTAIIEKLKPTIETCGWTI